LQHTANLHDIIQEFAHDRGVVDGLRHNHFSACVDFLPEPLHFARVVHSTRLCSSRAEKSCLPSEITARRVWRVRRWGRGGRKRRKGGEKGGGREGRRGEDEIEKKTERKKKSQREREGEKEGERKRVRLGLVGRGRENGVGGESASVHGTEDARKSDEEKEIERKKERITKPTTPSRPLTSLNRPIQSRSLQRTATHFNTQQTYAPVETLDEFEQAYRVQIEDGSSLGVVAHFRGVSWKHFSTVSCIVISHRNTLQHTATHRNTLQHTVTHCSTLQHTRQLYSDFTPQIG